MTLLTCSIIGLILLIWFRTEAWVEYTRLFHLDFLSFYKEYDAMKYQDVSLNYHLYLRREHNCFFIRMITCPICLAVWLGILAIVIQAAVAFLGAMFFHVGVVLFLAMLLSVAVSLPYYILGGLGIYLVANFLLK